MGDARSCQRRATVTTQALWTPSHQRIASSRWQAFIQHLQAQGIDPGDDLHAWSVAHRADFWRELVHFLAIPMTPYARVISNDGMLGATWFAGAHLNVAEILLRANDDDVALITLGEQAPRRCLSFAQLRHEVARLAAFWQSLGCTAGDRIATILPVGAEAAIAYLAAASLGLVYSSCSPDFGLNGLYDRLQQIAPKLIVAAPWTFYGGRAHDQRDKIRQLQTMLPGEPGLLWTQYTEDEGDRATTWYWPDLAAASGALEFHALPFAHPLCILFTSGTTGIPKCIVHSAGGSLLQHLKELALHVDLHAGDRLLFYTSTGWMMWNWMISALALGVTLVLYDGAPFAPDTRLWDIVEAEHVTHLGAGAQYFAECNKRHLQPAHTHHLCALRSLLSTGSPLAHETFDYLYRDVADDIAVQSISGGTDILSCFALGRPTQPIYRGELQGPGLAMDVVILDPDGKALAPGQKGELCCRSAFPSMPLGFWADPDGQRYHQAYFSRFPGLWAHGDFAELTTHGGLIIHGRSDAILNPGGVRIGTAEIYRQVEAFPEILEALAVAQAHAGDERIVLFVRLAEGRSLDAALEQRLRERLRQQASPRHVPAIIMQAPALPRTRSGKLAELAVKQTLHGARVDNVEALANPEALDWFKHLPALQEGGRPPQS